MSIYLDYNATTPINEDVLNVMIDVYRNHFGNADSRTHDYGDDCRKIVEEARSQVGDLLSVDKTEVFFTSGSTESSNIALQGLRDYANKAGKHHIVTTSIEHKAVLETVKALASEGFEVEYVSPDRTGRVSAEDVLSRVREDTLVVSVMHVNNETGIIQPVIEIGEALSEKEIYFHVDATQSCGKLVDELRSMKYDMLSISAHKMEGPQGIGALILKKKKYRRPPVTPIMYGGPQEHGISPGTSPVALIAGFGKACEIASQTYKKTMRKCDILKGNLLKQLEASEMEVQINGDQHYAVPTCLNFSIKGVSSEALMLSSKQYCGISNGSACNSNSYSPSYVLSAMGLSEDELKSSIRISWGANTDEELFETNIAELLEVACAIAF